MAVDSRRRARPKATRRLGPTGLVAALVPLVLCAILSLWEPFGVRALRDLEFDIFQRWSPRTYDPESPVRVVAVDDESLQRLGQWPWPRAELAALIDKLTAAVAAAVVLDVLFAEPERASARRRKATVCLRRRSGAASSCSAWPSPSTARSRSSRPGSPSPATIRVPSCRPSPARCCRSPRSASPPPVSAQ